MRIHRHLINPLRKLLHALRDSVFHEPMDSVTDRYKLIEYWGRP